MSPDADQLLSLHSTCECRLDKSPLSNHVGSEGTNADEATANRISKDNCTLTIEGLIAAFDCDECAAFEPDELRPDVIALRACDGSNQWIVSEMKLTMRERAGRQAAAGLARLGSHPLYAAQLDSAEVVFVVKRRRKSDRTIMRAIGTIREGHWAVNPLLLDSGSTHSCPMTDM
ncbi:MAG: hypothetical protein OXH86_19500 [Acidimicrobiaceae bacterium]|nr:hypothetical protein [Acidimicrobiaceae bacterium]